MSAATAAIPTDAATPVPMPAETNVVPLTRPGIIGGVPVPADMFAEAKAGAERLLRMPPDELRALIARRVEMLDTELKEREARRAAIEEALIAQRVLDAKRRRARRLRRKVNIGSSVAAAMFTGFVMVNMF